ncbi:hypothetical protein SK128_000764, partial [Halocaridina rubra]
ILIRMSLSLRTARYFRIKQGILEKRNSVVERGSCMVEYSLKCNISSSPMCFEDSSNNHKNTHTPASNADGEHRKGKSEGCAKIYSNVSHGIPFKRRQHLTPGSRVSNLLSQQYWKETGVEQKTIEKSAGRINEEEDERSSEQHLQMQKSIRGNECPKPESVMKTLASSIQSRDVKHVFTASKLRHQRRLDVSSRLNKLLENVADTQENATDSESNKESS